MTEIEMTTRVLLNTVAILSIRTRAVDVRKVEATNRRSTVEGDEVLQRQARMVAVAVVAEARILQVQPQQLVLLALRHMKPQSGGSARNSERQRSDVSILTFERAHSLTTVQA